MTAASTALLRAENDATRVALAERDSFAITHFPFNVGRESRATSSIGKIKQEIERRLGHARQVNDLYLLDYGFEGLHISREHFRIEVRGGQFVVVDRGSTLGTIVGTRRLGKEAGVMEAEIRHGDVLIVGAEASPYRFRFEIS